MTIKGEAMTKPQRIQRKRTKGWKMPENTVYVGRGSKWGNPFRVVDGWTAESAVREYRAAIDTNGSPSLIREALAGRNLACWCRLDQPCHADVLLELANQ